MSAAIRPMHILILSAHGPCLYPEFDKGGGAVASGARSQDFFGQFSGLLGKNLGQKGWACAPCAPLPPSGFAPVYRRHIDVYICQILM